MRKIRIIKISPMEQPNKGFWNDLVVASAFLLATLLLTAHLWILRTFGTVTMDKLIFQIKVPLAGTDPDFIRSFFFECIMPSVILVALATTLFSGLAKNGWAMEWRSAGEGRRFLLFPNRRLIGMLSTILLFASAFYSFNRLEATAYVVNMANESTFIEENYVDAQAVEIVFPAEKRNLIYIFMESMEATYFPAALGGQMSEDLIPELSKIAEENLSFSHNDALGGFQQLTGTGWTIAAMVAHHSGLPLLVPIEMNSYGLFESFLPGAYTLGDILEREGYRQMLMVGSDSSFGGRKNYYKQHGGLEILDYYSAKRNGIIPVDYRVWWGMEDQKLFPYAKQEILKLAEGGEPFHFALLTVDTHHVGGYVCELCTEEHESQYANVISCSSRQVANFLLWLQEQDFYENTTVVLVGDHLSMDRKFFAENEIDGGNRFVYNAFLNSAVTTNRLKNRSFSAFDLFPTTLAAMGVTIEGDALALGRNLFSAEPTLLERYGLEYVESELQKRSAFYEGHFLYGG